MYDAGYPKLIHKQMGNEANVGFTTFDQWFTFSPAFFVWTLWLKLLQRGRLLLEPSPQHSPTSTFITIAN